MSHSTVLNCPRIFIDPGNDYIVSTQLTTAISNTQDNNFTITATDTSNFKQSGYISINQEIFFYNSKTNTQFNNVFRALKNTSRKDHIINSNIQQTNEPINTLLQDTKLAGWYIDGYSNQASLRVQDSPVIQTGVIRYLEDPVTPSNSRFQGCIAFTPSGPVWQDFNARKGDKGDEGDINATLNFIHVSNNITDNDLNSGAIIKTVDVNTQESNAVSVRRLVSGSRQINFTDTKTVDISTNNDSVIINPKPQPFVPSLLNPITTLKGNDNKSYGDTLLVYIKPGSLINKGQVVRYQIYKFNNNYYIVVEPYTYTSSELLSKYQTSADKSSREIAGIALETYDMSTVFDSLQQVLICTKGICQIKIESETVDDSFTTTRNISYVGKPCIMSINGLGLCLASSEKPNVNYIELGGFIESYSDDTDLADFAEPGSFVFINLNPKYVEP